jgi:uncharacterized RDD family membrane protein YckC
MSPASVSETRFCSECGQSRPAGELARFGDRLICPACKDSYAQKLREGVAPATAMVYAGFWIRFLAVPIDGIILFIVDTILELVLLGTNSTRIAATNPAEIGATMSKLGMIWLISLAVQCSYETFFIGKMAATPGKMALGLKVVRPDGSPVDYGRAAGRFFAKMLSMIILMIGYIMAGFDAQKRALHDMICDTRVIKSRG